MIPYVVTFMVFYAAYSAAFYAVLWIAPFVHQYTRLRVQRAEWDE